MPFSDASNTGFVSQFLRLIQPKVILDVGAGAGKYGVLVRQICPSARRVAIEVWHPYVDRFGLRDIYDEVIVQDVKAFELHTNFDVVFFGDVLEHMAKADAIATWERFSTATRYGVISIPIVPYPQGAAEGNPYEVHVVDNWTHDDVMESFPRIVSFATYDTTATYIADFSDSASVPSRSN